MAIHQRHYILEPSDRLGILNQFWPPVMLLPVMCGASLHPFDLCKDGLTAIVDWLSEHQVTHYSAFTSAHRQIIDALMSKSYSTSIRCVSVTGEPILAADVAKFDQCLTTGTRLLNHYSASESPHIATYIHEAGAVEQFPTLPAGFCDPEMSIKLIDEYGKAVAHGEAGEIIVSGPSVARGYWQAPELTSAAFKHEGEMSQFQTGDIGYLDEDNCLHILGRLDQQVKISGQRVLPTQVEAAAKETGMVTAVAVKAITNDYGDARLVAYIVPQSLPEFSAIAFRKSLQRPVTTSYGASNYSGFADITLIKNRKT